MLFKGLEDAHLRHYLSEGIMTMHRRRPDTACSKIRIPLKPLDSHAPDLGHPDLGRSRGRDAFPLLWKRRGGSWEHPRHQTGATVGTSCPQLRFFRPLSKANSTISIGPLCLLFILYPVLPARSPGLKCDARLFSLLPLKLQRSIRGHK